MIKTYQDALDRSPLSASTKRIYRSRVAGFLAWLVDADVEGDPLSDPFARDFAVRDYRTHLKETHHAPASVNAALAAVDHFYSVRGLGPANARREALPQAAPRALDPGDQRRFLRALEQTESSRDRAIGLLGFIVLDEGVWCSEVHYVNGHRRDGQLRNYPRSETTRVAVTLLTALIRNSDGYMGVNVFCLGSERDHLSTWMFNK